MKSESYTLRAILSTSLLLVFSCSVVYGQNSRAPIRKGPAAESTNSPSLKDTLAWIQERMASDANYSEGIDQFGYFTQNARVDGCTISYLSVMHAGKPIDDLIGFRKTEVKFSLTSIDPASVVVREVIKNDFEVSFDTIGKQPKIYYKHLSEKEDEEYKTHGALPFNDKEIADRFAKAFIHASKLCQARKEPF